MIATITANPAVDRTVIIPGFALGRTNRIQREQLNPGGKGVNVAIAARQLGCAVVATGFVAGNNGRSICEALAARGISPAFVSVPGETRVNLKIIDPIGKIETEINEPGFLVQPEHLEQLIEKVEALASRSAVMVFSGSLPPGAAEDTYTRFIEAAKKYGTKTILDTAGPPLERSLSARPDLVKPNRAEVEELLGTRLDTEQKLIQAAYRLLSLGAGSVVISLGPEGALAAFGDKLIRAHVPFERVGSTVGAGDTMVAMFAYALMHGLPMERALVLATAASSATAAAEDNGVDQLKTIEQSVPQVVLQELKSIRAWARSK